MANIPLLLLIGAAVGALACWAWLQPKLIAQSAQAEALRAQLAEAEAAKAQLAAFRSQLSGLRHDVRGILSPALLVSDRLLTHGEPHVRRAGEVMVKTVQRASERLSETRVDQDTSGQKQA